jgi:broad specificity phosphatase PhoE
MGKLILLRHGHAYNQKLDLLAGDQEFPLTAKGRAQAKILAELIDGEKLAIDKVYCSTVNRCKDTIEYYLVNSNIAPIYTDSLREINVGDYAHMEYEKIHEMPDFADFGFKSGRTFPGGESFKDFRSRVENFIDNLSIHENSLLVTHSGVINIILHRFYNIDIKYFPIFNIKNCLPYHIIDLK